MSTTIVIQDAMINATFEAGGVVYHMDGDILALLKGLETLNAVSEIVSANLTHSGNYVYVLTLANGRIWQQEMKKLPGTPTTFTLLGFWPQPEILAHRDARVYWLHHSSPPWSRWLGRHQRPTANRPGQVDCCPEPFL